MAITEYMDITLYNNESQVKQKSDVFVLPDWKTIIHYASLVLLGSLTYAIYPVVVNVFALVGLVVLFYLCLHKGSHFLFFTSLFIGNLFTFGIKFGGVYNLAAFVAILIHLIAYKNSGFHKKSIFPGIVKFSFIVLLFAHALSTFLGNSFLLGIQLGSIFSFAIIIVLVYYCSRIQFAAQDIINLLTLISLAAIYMLVVAVNQKYQIINIDLPFIPAAPDSTEFEFGIIRSGSTLLNFESYAEFCLSVITIFLPGIITGSIFRKNKMLYFLSLIIVLVQICGLIVSGTRSSLFLLPVVVAFVGLITWKRVRLKSVAFMLVIAGAFFALNQEFQVVEFQSIIDRTKEIDFAHLSLEKLASGEEMNRGHVFEYAFKEVQKSNGIIGKGYFTTPDEYRLVHFKKGAIDDRIADFHNLYMSSYVLWGIGGFLAILVIFFFTVFQGFKVYARSQKSDQFIRDILLGLTCMFAFFMANQFKIQFIRDINYVMIIFLLLPVFYNTVSLLRHTNHNLTGRLRP